MKKSEKEELEHYRAQKKREYDYRNKYTKEKYRRLNCVYPIERSDAIDKAIEISGSKSVSAYVTSLIDRDLKEKGLID